ncbi:MAG TPA: SIMPL domain-containing protein [Pyrinomonadaceae bacterium]|nr:SIMPL domain-containing protein [Pyrinomonadaceae bacterium]
MRKRISAILCALALISMLTSQAFAKEITVHGRLQKTVEAGGWLIATNGEKYLILNATQFQNQSWFKEGSEVEATGETKPDAVTIYMEGVPFEARTMRPLQGTATGGGQESQRFTRVRVGGDAIVQAQPDTAIVTISVVSQARQALQAQQETATKSDAVVRTVKAAMGAGAEIKTSGYSLVPQRIYKENQPPTIVGYEARNSVTVTISDLTKVGAVIDAASEAGANDITGIGFTLRKDRPAKDQALSEATRTAIGKAQVIAKALNGRVVRVVEVQEEGLIRPMPVYEAQVDTMRARVGAATPIEVGTLDVSSRVQLIAEIEVG